MSVKMSAKYLGQKKVRLSHEPSGTTLNTAAPADNAGDGSSFSPTDLVGAALGSCILTTIAIAAERDGLDLPGMSIEVEKNMQQSPRRVAELRVKLSMPKLDNPEQRAKYERIAHSCPVHKSLHPDVHIPIEISWAE